MYEAYTCYGYLTEVICGTEQSVSLQWLEEVLTAAITRHMKESGKRQEGFTKGKWCLTNLIALCDETTC